MLWEISFKYILQILETVWDTKSVFKYGAACETGWLFLFDPFQRFCELMAEGTFKLWRFPERSHSSTNFLAYESSPLL